MTKNFFAPLFIGVFCVISCISQENPPEVKTPDQSKFTTETVVDGLEIPWGMDFISKNEILVTEKKGILYRISNGEKAEVSGLPEIYQRGQGGLLDVALHPDFKNNKVIYFTAAVHLEGDTGGNTALYCAELNGTSLSKVKLLYKGKPNTKKGQHWGSRIVFDHEGHLFFAIGDRGNRDVNPQDLKRDGGKIYRLNLDGSIPKDNPFVNQEGALKAVYSYGHRNPQGMAINPITNDLWIHEHGPRGGDEINIIKPGKNYGWPLASYGVNYIGTKFTDNKVLPGTEQPIHYWVPSIAPSGMVFVDSNIYPEFKNSILIGSLKFEYLHQCIFDGDKIIEEKKILDKIGRVRSLEVGPNGYIYVGIENLGIIKILPN